MSLITEALQLRTSAPRVRSSSGESFPPLRRTPPAAKILFVLLLLCGGGVLAVWKGAWALEKIETLAGTRLSADAPVVASVESAPVPLVAAPADPAVSVAALPVPEPVPAKAGGEPAAVLPEELKPMDVNLSLALIEDERARQQIDEENQRKIESFLRRMDVQGVCHQGENSTALLDTVLVRPGDPVGDLGLSLKKIEVRRLVFADRDGREYTKSY